MRRAQHLRVEKWSKILRKRNLKCTGCGSKVELFRPKPKVHFSDQETLEEDVRFDADSGNEAEGVCKPLPAGILRSSWKRAASPGGKRGDKGKGSSVQELLQQAVATAKDPQLQADLQAQLGKLGQGGPSRHAEGERVGVQAKEKPAALALAEAADSKLQAAQAVAKAEGVKIDDAANGKSEGNQDNPMISARWDESFFDSLDDSEATETEKTALAGLRDQLKGVKPHLLGKETEIQQWLQMVQAHRMEIEGRLAKKRRQAVPDDPT
ncbi:unnamed protein product, partial [Prorocentrum cordatum]